MAWLFWVLIALEIPLAWFIWTFLHEMSHVIVAKKFFGARSVRMWLHPHWDERNNFYFARVTWQWPTPPPLPSKRLSTIWLAPRLMNAVAVVMLPFACVFGTAGAISWSIFWGAGLVDLAVGSVGGREFSDLQRSSRYLGWNPWVLRCLGFGSIVLSFLSYLVLLLVV